jgi:acyl transferase domain-containing protein
MEKAMGSRTSVHVGCLAQEYSHVSQRDTNLPGSYQIVGSNGLSMLANRLSWFYDFTGPSMAVDTACSSGLLAVHLACQDLLSGSADMVDTVHRIRNRIRLTSYTGPRLRKQSFSSP